MCLGMHDKYLWQIMFWKPTVKRIKQTRRIIRGVPMIKKKGISITLMMIEIFNIKARFAS